ncbi:hypothetical protein [Dysgonomonas sp. 520]|uniref:hypothetical protein n=1 Tax=Dysgonomonas sp. 520 TaxID=2302931 RepID=UPI0013CFEFBF|nr:hypothetical protein [Dysgonomonas sp. 520]NDW10945.1 hypothetical protein [Dysgonomonas sp. 520]
MARNFPEVWVGRVETNLKTTDEAPWLDGIPEITSPVVVLGEGTDTEKNIINIPTSEFEVEVLINNSTYPIALQDYTDDTAIVALDKYQTKVTTLADDDVMGAAYDKIDSVTKGHVSSITSEKYIKAIHAIAPTADSVNTPVIETGGNDDGDGRKMITRREIIKLKKKFDQMQCPANGRRLVLCADHVQDLLNSDQKFADQYYNYVSGKISNLYGFQVYEYIANPYFNPTTKQKVSFGAVPAADDYQASVAFYAPNIGKKTGKTKQYYSDAKTDPENQTNKINYRHYFIAIPKRAKYIGAIISSKA